MKKKQINQRFLVLLLFISTILVYASIFNYIHQQPAFNIPFHHKDKQHSITRRILNRFTSEKNDTLSVYYRLSSNARYHYEFRFEFNPSTKSDHHRLMLILSGAPQKCRDMWKSDIGLHILTSLHHSGYSILTVCAQRNTYDIDVPIAKNNDVKYMYLSLQSWMNTVYYSRFKRYPLLYMYSFGRGANFASILCRVLPIQGQILHIDRGHSDAMFTSSAYDSDLQTRLILDPTFANWFYFDFCYNRTATNMDNQTLCPFQSNRDYFFPLPPTFFTNLKNDSSQNEEILKDFITKIPSKALHLGGILLTNIKTMQFDLLPPIELTVSYMQETFPAWHSKPDAVQLFLEHLTNPTKYRTNNLKRQTCWCSDIDFQYFELLSNVTMTWTRKKREEYNDYVKDIREFEDTFCEKVCDDLITTRSMISRNINKTLMWINEMDELRRSLYLDDYLKRPLRIWMYDKKLLIKPSMNFSSAEPNWVNISKEFQMYSPEYYLQDYFQRLNGSEELHHHHLRWAVNPLLADYFIIPSDLMFFYFHHHPQTLHDPEFKKLMIKLNENYFETLLTSIRTNFPYWTLATQADQIGANHILPIPGGRNMGILFNKTQNLLKNVIQLAFSGIRQDLLPPNATLPYGYRGIHITYRHHYDVIVPQTTPFNMNRSRLDNLDILIKKKKRLFYFAGALFHATSATAARARLSSLWRLMNETQKSNRTTTIQGRQFPTVLTIDGYIKPHEYVDSIQSTVFSLCPEGFLPWSPRLYEAIQMGATPLLLVDNIVLPFERFIDWRSFSAKIHVKNIANLTNIVHRITNLEQYIKQKLQSALPFLHAFRWPYLMVNTNGTYKHIFQPRKDKNESGKNVFYYLSLELRCRRLEQWYGLTVDTSTARSKEAQRLACINHPTICPCHNETRSLAFHEYV